MNELTHWDFDGLEEPSHSGNPGAETEDPWDAWQDLPPGLPEDQLWDAFDLDDALNEPQPEYGDFWFDEGDEEDADR